MRPLLFLAFGLVIFLYNGLSYVTFPYTIDYAEGPLPGQVAKLSRFESIYRPDLSEPPYTISNYTPLFLLVQAPFYWLFGPTYWYGRLISLLSTLVAAGSIWLIIRRFSDRRHATIGAAVFLTIPYVVHWGSLGKTDALALALSLAALAVVARRPDRWWLAAGLLVAAVYTRQTYGLAAPLAASVWLFYLDRGKAVRFVAAVAGMGLAVFAIANTITGGGFWFNIFVANANPFHRQTASNFFHELLFVLPVLLALGLLLFRYRLEERWLVGVYLVGAALSAATIGKIGSNTNYFLELCAALAMASVLVMSVWEWRPGLYRAVTVALVLQVVWFAPWWVSANRQLIEIEQVERQALEIIRATDGPVLADQQMGVLSLLSRPIYMQPFVATQLAAVGLWDQTEFLRDVESRRFALILVTHQPGPGHNLVDQRWTPEALQAIEAHYHLDEIIKNNVSSTLVYRPKKEDLSGEAVGYPTQ